MISAEDRERIHVIATTTSELYQALVNKGMPVAVAEQMVLMFWHDQLEEAHK